MPKLPDMLRDMEAHYALGVEVGRLVRGEGRLEYERTMDLLKRWLPGEPSLGLDIGGGPGVYSFALTRWGHRVHLLDLMPNHIEAARKTENEINVRLESARLGDARDLPFPDASADFVLLMGPLYHLTDATDRHKALDEACRCLRPGGVLVASAICRYASLIDGSAEGFVCDPVFQALVSEDLRTGQHRNPTSRVEYFTSAYFHRPEDLEAEFTAVGLRDVALAGVEGPVWKSTRLDEYLADPMCKASLMEWLRTIESVPSILGASAHLLARGTKS